jgi:uncharacterized protein YbjT (DUF2867 family)
VSVGLNGPVADVVVAGATGALGSKICHELLRLGATVRALVRNPASDRSRSLAAAGVDLVRGDVGEPASLAAALAGATCVVSTATCFPHTDDIAKVDRDGNLALVDAACAARLERFVFVSFKPVPLDFPLQRAKRAVEQRLAQADLDSIVLRPGKFMDVWFSSLCGFDPSARRATLFGEGKAPVSWIAAADVAAIAARAVTSRSPHTGTIELGGPEALSQSDVIAIYEEMTGAAWTIETLPVAELERMCAEGESETVRSLGALMLESHLGSTTDPASFRQAFPVRLTTVREFAAVYSPSG